MDIHNSIDVTRLLAEVNLAEVKHLPTISSTQDYAHQLALDESCAGCDLPVLIIADEQTAGRGRAGNKWWTAPGSLAISVLAEPSVYGLSSQPTPQASLAAAVAVIDAVVKWTDPHPIGLHWPNDVFLAGRKLSGILIDILPDGRHILGIGLNINNSFTDAPEEVRGRATSLAQIVGRPLNRTDVLLALMTKLHSALEQLAKNPELLGQRFDELCLQIGHDLTIESAGRRTIGRCAGVANDGALLLDTLSGRQKFYSGALK